MKRQRRSTRSSTACLNKLIKLEFPSGIARLARRLHPRRSLVASSASGVARDEPAVRAAITLPSSNGQTEGQITKLKLVKRLMYGRAKIDLLQARLIGVPA
jgi:transposase